MKTIIHQHLFKSGGTTFASLLARNFGDSFRCVERHKGLVSWTDVAKISKELGLRAVSSHAIRGAASSPDFFKVCFLREPRSRIVSAWNFERRRGSFDGAFEGYLKQKVRKNFQSWAYYGDSDQKPIDDASVIAQSVSQGRLRMSNSFLGVVERYDESLCLLETALRRHRIFVDLSYGKPQNAADGPLEKLDVPYEWICEDEDLYKYAKRILDLEIQLNPNFEALFKDFRNRCHARRQTDTGRIHPLALPANWIFVDGR